MRILFTGHRGFLGRELIPELESSYEIFKYQEDLRDRASLLTFLRRNKIDSIIHAAAKGANRYQVQTENTLCDNLKMSANVAFTELPVLIFCSGKIYGNQLPIEGSNESECLSRFPNDFYGQSKFIFYNLAKDLDNLTFLRFFNVFGATEPDYRFIRANINRALKGKPMLIHQDLTMDTFYVKDSLPIIRSWIERDSIPQNLNLVYKSKYLLSEICSLILEITHSKVEIEVQNQVQGNDYFGNGSLLASLDYSLKGLEVGLSEVANILKDLDS